MSTPRRAGGFFFVVVNVAVTLVEPFTVTVQVVAVPLQAPPQPVNFAPFAGVALSVTDAPAVSVALHVTAPLPQLMPPPLTLPEPETTADSRGDEPPPLPVEKVADTDLAAVIETVHVVADPEHAPPQPVKVLPLSAVSLNVTFAFAASTTLQTAPSLPQLIPPPMTVPSPVTLTVSPKPLEKFAVTLRDATIDTVHVVDVPPHAPVQPLNVAPVAAVATRVTLAFWAKLAEQMLAPPPQLIAPLPPLTFPAPLTVTLSETAVANAAETLITSLIVTVQVEPVPLQSPPQPVNA